MMHIYCGDGKGKTTAAFGLALRAVGSGMKVSVTQFLKDGSSSELGAISSFENVKIHLPKKDFGWFQSLSDEEITNAKEVYMELLQEIMEDAKNYELLVLDEAIWSYHYGLLDKEMFLEFLAAKKGQCEIILTGRNPDEQLLSLADYVTEMKKIRHPYDIGLKARKGIEF